MVVGNMVSYILVNKYVETHVRKQIRYWVYICIKNNLHTGVKSK